jgi:hypothetical protein
MRDAPSIRERQASACVEKFHREERASSMFAHAIAIREKHGLVPIDDGLPGEPETPFHTTPSPHDEGAHCGEARPE